MTNNGDIKDARWQSDLATFTTTPAAVILNSLEEFVRGFSPQQSDAWRESILFLQSEVAEFLPRQPGAGSYGIVLEYKLPYDGRRPDVIVLTSGAVVVIEFKGKEVPSQADLDQVAAYARDLKAYHRECQDRDVYPVLVPTKTKNSVREKDGVTVASPDRLGGIFA